MCASPLSFLRNGPPPPRVALLPDALFFTREIPVAADATASTVATDVELSLEANSPFPLAQLYYGFYWVAGSAHALAYAAYRRRFTVEQTDLWDGSDYVFPSFVSFLGTQPEPATTLLISAPEGLTAVYWKQGPVPSEVLFRPLAAEATDEDRLKAKDELLKRLPGSMKVVEVTAPATAEPRKSDGEVAFTSGGYRSALRDTALAQADVRDRGELAAIKRSKARDLILWRVAVGTAAAFAVLALGELALIGGGVYQKTQLMQLSAQKPVVDKVMTEQALASRIEELSTKRLLPMEMLSIVADKKPAEIQFIRATTTGLYSLQVEAQTSNPGEIGGFQTALQQAPACDKVQVTNQQARNNVASFTLLVSFKPDLLKPAAALPASPTPAS